jgi:hypothetical protein
MKNTALCQKNVLQAERPQNDVSACEANILQTFQESKHSLQYGGRIVSVSKKGNL